MSGVRAFFRSLAAEVLPRCPCVSFHPANAAELPPVASAGPAAGEDCLPPPPPLAEISTPGWMCESEEQLLARREQLLLQIEHSERRLEEARVAIRVAHAHWLAMQRDFMENELRLSLLPVRSG